MTAHKVVIIECNECGTTALPENMIVKDVIHIVGVPDHVVGARHHAAAKRWLHSANGKDLCPACRTTPGAPDKAHLLSRIPHPHWGHES